MAKFGISTGRQCEMWLYRPEFQNWPQTQTSHTLSAKPKRFHPLFESFAFNHHHSRQPIVLKLFLPIYYLYTVLTILPPFLCKNTRMRLRELSPPMVLPHLDHSCSTNLVLLLLVFLQFLPVLPIFFYGIVIYDAHLWYLKP